MEVEATAENPHERGEGLGVERDVRQVIFAFRMIVLAIQKFFVDSFVHSIISVHQRVNPNTDSEEDYYTDEQDAERVDLVVDGDVLRGHHDKGNREDQDASVGIAELGPVSFVRDRRTYHRDFLL